MVKKETPSVRSGNFRESDIDPEIASKVDQMMSSEPKSTSAPEIKSDETTTQPAESAPLLPSDKLPTEIVSPSPQKANQAIKPEQLETVNDLTELKDKTIDEARFAHDSVGLEDPETDKAVDDIVNQESDRMLAIEDAKAELLSEGSATIDNGFFASLKVKLVDLLSNKWFRRSIALILLLTVAGTVAYPTSRYFILNTVGVRASTSMTVLDDKTKQPLKNVEVSISGKNATTDAEGFVKLEKIKLGAQEVAIKKPAFAESYQTITFGWGSNPLGEINLTAVGSRYSFLVTDFLSGSSIRSAEAISGDASAVANPKGEIVLVVADDSEDKVPVEIKADDYKTVKLDMPVGNQEVKKIELVSSRKHAFVSKREGSFDLYKTDVDGKNEEKVLAGTGNEREEGMILLQHPTKDIVAFVSTREKNRSANGEVLSSLNIVDLNTNEAAQIALSERVQLIDFIGDKLVFVKIAEGASEEDLKRHRLISYDIETAEEKELASTNYFNDVLIAGGSIFYSSAAYKVNGKVGFYRINADGSGKESIYSKEIWNIFRTSYGALSVSTGQNWYEYNLENRQFSQLDGAPSAQKSRVYVTSPDGKKSLWVDTRDGKGVMLLYSHDSQNDKILRSVGGLSNPIRWLDSDHAVYRISTNTETADYIISLSGGEPRKIQDVTDTAGLDRWYYY